MTREEDIKKLDRKSQEFFANMPRLAIELLIEEQIINPLKSEDKDINEIKQDIRDTDMPIGVQEYFVKIAKEEYYKIHGKTEDFDNPLKRPLTKMDEDRIIEKALSRIPPPEKPLSKDEVVEEIMAKLPPPPENGKDAVVDYPKIVADVISILPPPKKGDKGNDGSPDTADEIAGKINSLSGVIVAKAIYGLEAAYDEIAELKKKKGGQGGMRGAGVSLFTFLQDAPDSYKGKAGYVVTVNAQENGLVFSPAGGSSNVVEDERPTGAINGSNKVFTLSQTPISAQSLQLFYNGQLQTRLTDFTITEKTVTFVQPPISNSVLQAWYRY